MLSDTQKRLLIQTVRQQLEAIIGGTRPDMSCLGFYSACLSIGVIPAWYKSARKEDPKFDEQCREIIDEIEQVIVEKAVCEAMISKDKIRDLVMVAERLNHGFALPARPQVSINKTNNILMAMLNGSAPEQIDEALSQFEDIDSFARGGDLEVERQMAGLAFMAAETPLLEME